MRRIVFRVDSSRELGGGHLQRCLTLARALRSIGQDSVFLARPLPGAMTNLAVVAGFRVLDLAVDPSSTEEDDATASCLALSKAGVEPLGFVVDAYHLGAPWERSVRQFAPVMVIDDLADRVHECILLLDQNLHADPDSCYAGLVPEECLLLIGPRWALLRSEFVANPRPSPRDGIVRRVLISYGGSDPTGETLKALQALVTVRGIPRIDIVVGPAFTTAAEILTRAALDPRIVIHEQPNNLAELMRNADLALGGGGSTAWERCYLALPAVVTTVADNQFTTTRLLAERGAVLYVGPAESVSPGDIGCALRRCLADSQLVRQTSVAAAEVLGESYMGAVGVASTLLEVLRGSS